MPAPALYSDYTYIRADAGKIIKPHIVFSNGKACVYLCGDGCLNLLAENFANSFNTGNSK